MVVSGYSRRLGLLQAGRIESVSEITKIVTGESAKATAKLFNYGNIVAILLPPLGMLWMGLSMLVYAMNRHHPNEKVGHYTQQAAYRLYALFGLLIPVATFFPGKGLIYYLITWAVFAAVLIPWSIIDIRRINRDSWEDVVIKSETLHE